MVELSLYDYDLPEELIAQTPLADRDASRLLVLRRSAASLAESTISRLTDFLTPGDCLVFNDTRVSPCKFRGRIDSRDVEFLVVQTVQRSDIEWEMDAMVYPGKRFKIGSRIDLGIPEARAEVLSISDIGRRIQVLLSEPPEELKSGSSFPDILNRRGEIPLPPYIRNPSIPPDRYQTCFAKEEGSAAAPTAGLHFTPDLFRRLSQGRIRTAFLTLHVGPGTFRPVTSREIASGRLHPEPYRLSAEAVEEIYRARVEGRRIVAVGTTVCRTLEHIVQKYGDLREDAGVTDLFIREGTPFRIVDALLTNFHLPRTSLLMLVSALAGREFLLSAYEEAIRRAFRFYSFGDAMLIL